MSRFNRLKAQLARKGVRNPAGLAATIGRKKYTPAGFTTLAVAGRKKAATGRKRVSVRKRR